MRYLWTTQKALGLVLVLIISIASALVWYWQPECEQCLSRVDCPPCISQQQYVTGASAALLILLTLGRSLVLTPHTLPKQGASA